MAKQALHHRTIAGVFFIEHRCGKMTHELGCEIDPEFLTNSLRQSVGQVGSIYWLAVARRKQSRTARPLLCGRNMVKCRSKLPASDRLKAVSIGIPFFTSLAAMKRPTILPSMSRCTCRAKSIAARLLRRIGSAISSSSASALSCSRAALIGFFAKLRPARA